MKKILKALLVLAILIGAVVCTACGEKAVKGEAEADTQEKTRVTIWHTWNVEEGGSEHELQVIVDEYNNSQSAVEVELVSQPSSGFAEKVYTNTAMGVGPNIYFNFANSLPEYVNEGLLADMGAYMDVEELKARLPKSLYEECVGFEDGKLHIAPIQSTASVVFYSKTIYDQLGLTAPATWEEVESNARAIYQAMGIPGFAADSYVDLGQMLFGQIGADYIIAAEKRIGFNTPECAQRMQWYVDGVNEGIFAANFETGSIDTDFNAGLLGSFVGTCSYEPYILPDGFEYAVASVPGTNGNYWNPLFGRGAIVLKADEKTEAAACNFVTYFTNAVNSARWGMSIGGLSPYLDAVQYEPYNEHLAASKSLQAAVISMESAETIPPVVGMQAVRNEMKQAFLNAIGGVKTPEEALKDADSNSAAALQG